jgi:hypothetical protein
MHRLQQAGKWLLFLLILAGLAGLLGSGPFSGRQVSDSRGDITIRYDRFARYDAPQRLQIEGNAGPGGRFDLWLDSSLIQNLKIESIIPEPARQSASIGRLELEMDLKPGSGRAVVLIHGRALTVGQIHGRIGTGDSSVLFRQLVYP